MAEADLARSLLDDDVRIRLLAFEELTDDQVDELWEVIDPSDVTSIALENLADEAVEGTSASFAVEEEAMRHAAQDERGRGDHRSYIDERARQATGEADWEGDE